MAPARGSLVSLQTKEQKAAAAAVEAEAKKIDDARIVKQEEFITEVLEKELAKREEAVREPLRKAFRIVAKDRTPEQVALLKQHPSVEKLSAGSLYLYDTTYKTKHADTLKKMTEEAAAVRAKKPKEELVHAFSELPTKPGAIPATFLFHRGNRSRRRTGEAVRPRCARRVEEAGVAGESRGTSHDRASPRLRRDPHRWTTPAPCPRHRERVWMHHFGTDW